MIRYNTQYRNYINKTKKFQKYVESNYPRKGNQVK